jgi:drug/metabolite transporter (DMT)-like permease
MDDADGLAFAPPLGAVARAPTDAALGVALAAASSLFIGASFIVKKKGLAEPTAGLRAGRMGWTGGDRSRATARGRQPRPPPPPGAGGYSYLAQPTWWLGLALMGVGEGANAAAYAFAPASLVTPLGALSIVCAAVLSHVFLGERMVWRAWLGCGMAVVGGGVAALHAPAEPRVASVDAIAALAARPGFLAYAAVSVALTWWLVTVAEPRWGAAVAAVPVGAASLLASFSVLGVQTLALAARLTLSGGGNQMTRPATWAAVVVVVACVPASLAFLNRALDRFPATMVTPPHYVMFTTATCTASEALFRAPQPWADTAAALCGFAAAAGGVALLHRAGDPERPPRRARDGVALLPVTARRGE